MVIEQLFQFSPLPRKGTLIDRANYFPYFFRRAIALSQSSIRSRAIASA
ncbi:hypothetical protein QT990_02120 [Microcoleus sp. T3_B1]